MTAKVEQWMRDAALDLRRAMNGNRQDYEINYDLAAEIIASHAPSAPQCSHLAFEWDKHMHNCFACLQRGYDFQYRQRSRLLERWPKSSGVSLPPEITGSPGEQSPGLLPSEAAAQPTRVGVDLAGGPDKTVFTCSICGSSETPCSHYTAQPTRYQCCGADFAKQHEPTCHNYTTKFEHDH